MHFAIPILSARRVKDLIKEKQDQRARAIATGLRVVQAVPKDDDTTYLSASACLTVEKIRSREWSALRVMQAYVRSAAEAHDRTNCLTEVMFVRALEDAKKLDEDLMAQPAEMYEDKLLLGLPVSLKDENDIQGVDSTIGFVK